MKSPPSGKAQGDRETVERLLDTAEQLFGQFGYDGVGMRMLTQQAKVNLGAATYHFGSKEALYLEIFLRRFRKTNAERLRLLSEAQAEAGGTALSVEKIVECMLRPPYQSGLEHPHFRLFLARSLFMPPPFLYSAIHKELGPNIEIFVAALSQVLPKHSKTLIRLRTMFAMGAMLMFSVQAANFSARHHARYDENLLREVVRFVSAGLQSPSAVPFDGLPVIESFPQPFGD